MFVRPRPATRWICQILATVVVAFFAFPLVAIVARSFDGQGFVANYTAVFTRTPFLRDSANSAIIALGTVAIVYATTMAAGYAFSKLHFTGRKLLFNALLVGLILPGITLLVPLFAVVQKAGLFNNYLAVVLPLSAFTVPFTVLLVRNYMNGVPEEILEAARIDGCTSFGTLLRIVVPLSRPISAVVVVWAFLQAWNEFFLPLLFLQDPSMQAVTQIPMYFTSTYGSDTPKIFAALVLVCLPIVIAYLALQKFFERGLTAGAVK